MQIVEVHPIQDAIIAVLGIVVGWLTFWLKSKVKK